MMLVKFDNNEIPLYNLLIIGEAHFCLSGDVNHQNCRCWASENLKIIYQTPLHDAKMTVWVRIVAVGIIGLYFFEESNVAVCFNKEWNIDMISNFLLPEPKDIVNLLQLCFNKEAPSHTPQTWRWKCWVLFSNIALSSKVPVWISTGRHDRWIYPSAIFFAWEYLKSRVISK